MISCGELACDRGAHAVQHDDQWCGTLGDRPGDPVEKVLGEQEPIGVARDGAPLREPFGERPVERGPAFAYGVVEHRVRGLCTRDPRRVGVPDQRGRAVGPSPRPHLPRRAVGDGRRRRLVGGQPAHEAYGGDGGLDLGGTVALAAVLSEPVQGLLDRLAGRRAGERQRRGDLVGERAEPGVQARFEDLAAAGEVTGVQFGEDLLGPSHTPPARQGRGRCRSTAA